jgi:hypothetical protein
MLTDSDIERVARDLFKTFAHNGVVTEIIHQKLYQKYGQRYNKIKERIFSEQLAIHN